MPSGSEHSKTFGPGARDHAATLWEYMGPICHHPFFLGCSESCDPMHPRKDRRPGLTRWVMPFLTLMACSLFNHAYRATLATKSRKGSCTISETNKQKSILRCKIQFSTILYCSFTGSASIYSLRSKIVGHFVKLRYILFYYISKYNIYLNL